MTSSRIFGPALAGVLVVNFGYPWAFTIDAFSYLAVLWALWRMTTSALRPPPRTARGKGQVREGLRYVRRMPDLRIPLIMVAVVGTLTFNFSVVLPLFVERTLHGNDTSYTLVYSVLSVGSFAGALLTAHRKSVEVRHVVTASFAFGCAMFLFAAAPNLLSAFPIALFVGLSSIAFMTASTAIVQVRADPAMRGRVLALQAMVLIGSTPVGGPILGAVCDAFGARTGLVIGGVAAVGAALYGRAAIARTAADEAAAAGGDVDVAADDLQPA
jgi:MFS family permease